MPPVPGTSENTSTEALQSNTRSLTETRVVAHLAKEKQQSRVLLATAMVKIKSSNGQTQIVRALIDQGSETSFITEATARAFQMKGSSVNGVVSGIGDGETRTRFRVSFVIQSLHNPNFTIPVDAFVLKKLTSYLPSTDVSIPDWPDIKYLPLADPTHGTPGRIDIILGVEVYGEILLKGLLKHTALSGPVAQNTQLGWILSGKINTDVTSNHRVISLHLQLKEDQLLKQFWEIEKEPDSIQKRMTKEEIRCEEIYEETTKRDKEGRYIVRLPFKIWRPRPHDPIQHYKLLRLTFGTSCAPYLAVKSLQQLAKDEQSKYPLAAQITLQDYYMDDLLTGCETTVQAIDIYKEMNNLMRAGGFELQKWCSNSDELLGHIEEENQRSNQSVVFKSNDNIKVLGLSWNKTTDEFEYHFNLPENDDQGTTKRMVLSAIARLYDPMGWIAPVIITSKIFIQNLWKSRLSWDEKLNRQLLLEWQQYKIDLENVKDIIIPRWLQTRSDDYIELHAFADASQAAYAAAVYLKSTSKDGKTVVNLVTAKTKVAPVEKEISIPRMELCAALLATKLLYEVSQIMNVPKRNIYAWSDSTVVLAWIAGEPSRWTTFVSNRISEILTMLDKDQWRHVTTDQNPADCASRGLSTSELVKYKLWWHGPKWLQQDEYQREPRNSFETSEETRAIKVLTATVKEKEDFIWTRFSNLSKMLRVLSYCKKILNLKLPKENRKTLSKIVSKEEKNDILKFCIKETQAKTFEEEINYLQHQKSIPKKSQLHSLNPLLDDNGILRVGGRIHMAQVDYDKRHPVILPCDSHLTKLIIQDAHDKTFHGGPQLMLNFLRTKYWVIRARECVKKCYRNCVTCLRYSQQNYNQLMGQLPETRLKPMRPFKISGVDFTGHINIRFSPGRGSKSYKGYICLFVCFSTKAIHLEAVSDLTSEGFIAAYRRFVSRRGHCRTLYSDNGTNFIGADKELREMFNRATSQLPDEIRHLVANEGTEWKFIPPQAPNFGGLWEAGVRSAKKHLKRVIGDSTLTFEELTTVLTQIEACLNSRPLSYLSENSDDPEPLTPGHFLGRNISFAGEYYSRAF
ncbi:hypothetical protein K1T71_015014 [Dendrolimus kikuchii]|nr:hypothetical protein K1T71_015014 [Dendrolimus kikuchii]